MRNVTMAARHAAARPTSCSFFPDLTAEYAADITVAVHTCLATYDTTHVTQQANRTTHKLWGNAVISIAHQRHKRLIAQTSD